jgi:sugar phosphate isomerase/epimerase
MAYPGFTLTGFADEIDSDLETQLSVLESLDIEHIEVRSVGAQNVLDLDDDEIESVKAELDSRGFTVSSIGSPIGKVDVTDPFEPHLERFERAMDVAERFETKYIRLFSYYIPEGEDPADYRDEVLRRMRRKAELVEERGLVLLNENEKDLYGDTPGRMRDIHLAVDSPNLRMVFDPANYLELGIRPYPNALLQVVEFVEYLHVKDAKLGVRGEMRPAGEGDGRIPETLEALAARGFEGYLSLEPHLQVAGEAGGFSDEEGFRTATRALTDVLESVDEEPPAAVSED